MRRRSIDQTALPTVIRYLREPEATAARGYLPGAVEELVRLAADEHGKDLPRLPETAWDADGPYFTDAGAKPQLVLASRTVEGDHRASVIYQAAPEAVHAAAVREPSWLAEMFAVWFAVRVVQALVPQHAEHVVAELEQEARPMTLEDMFGATLSPYVRQKYPSALYGRAYLTALALDDALGWPALRQLVDAFPDAARAVVTEALEDRRSGCE